MTIGLHKVTLDVCAEEARGLRLRVDAVHHVAELVEVCLHLPPLSVLLKWSLDDMLSFDIWF